MLYMQWSYCNFLSRRMHTSHQQNRREIVTTRSLTNDSRETAGFAIRGQPTLVRSVRTRRKVREALLPIL
jgi:hypothetical protein